MKGLFCVIFVSGLLFGLAQAQVASAELLGVAETRPPSEASAALYADGSVGEVVVRVRALDASGNPVVGAAVSWTLTNRTTAPAYVVDSSGDLSSVLLLLGSHQQTLDGGVTDENGEAYLTIDARSQGDVSLAVTVDGADAKTYDGGDMRVVWF